MKLFLILLLSLSSACSSLLSQSYFNEVGKLSFGFYHTVMSPIRSNASRCGFRPSCSAYSKECIHRYGAIIGLALTADRLMRCTGNRDVDLYSIANGYFQDSPSRNYLFGSCDVWAFHMFGDEFGKDNTGTNGEKYFTRALFLEGDYNNSILELKREKFNSIELNKRDYLNCLIAVNLIHQQKYYEAYPLLNYTNVDSDTNRNWNHFVLKYLLANYQNKDSYLPATEYISSFPSIEKQIILNRMKIFSLVRRGNIDNAFETIKNESANDEILISSLDLIKNGNDYSTKSPAVAGILSAILPGTGYFYCGNVSEGFSALLINSLLGVSIYSLFKNENIGSGILVSMISMPFYFGNIIGSVNSAMNYNNRQKALFENEVMRSLKLDFYFSRDFLIQCWDAL